VIALKTQLLILANILWLPLCRINKFGLNTLPSKTVGIPYTCGLSRPFSGAVAGEHSYICGVTWDYYQIITMKNLKDAKTKIFPSKMRGGKELPSSSALDSPTVISRLATPPHVINSDMSQVIDDATSAMNATHDDASTLLDDNVPLGKFLDEQLARTKAFENAETDEIVETDEELETKNLETPIRPSSPRYELPKVLEGYVTDEETTRDILACKDRDDLEKLLCKYKEKTLNQELTMKLINIVGRLEIKFE
jgi:hypothetical protein